MFLLLYPLSQALRYVTGAQGEEEAGVQKKEDNPSDDNNTDIVAAVDDGDTTIPEDPSNVINADGNSGTHTRMDDSNSGTHTRVDDSNSGTPTRLAGRNHLFCMDSVESSECNTPEHRCSPAHQVTRICHSKPCII